MKFKSVFYTLFLVTTISLIDSSFALDIPKKSRADGRIQYVNYSNNNVTKINAVNGYITTITFSSDETVENYGSGFSTAWEFASSANHFFLKPKDKDGTTNIVIVTNKRVYSIDVHLVKEQSQATYQLMYRYPDEIAQAEAKKAQEQALSDELERTDPNILEERPFGNYQYTMSLGKDAGSQEIVPSIVFDDGKFTYFKFKKQIDFPSVYRVTANGEAIVNSHVEKGVLVVHGVYKEFRLRSGISVVGIYNENYNGGSIEASDGTSVKNVTRGIKK